MKTVLKTNEFQHITKVMAEEEDWGMVRFCEDYDVPLGYKLVSIHVGTELVEMYFLPDFHIGGVDMRYN